MAQKPKKKPEHHLRQFGGILTVIISVIAYVLKSTFLGILAIAVISATLLCPLKLARIEKFLIKLGDIMGFVMTRIILSIFYYLCVTPMAIILKILGKSLMPLRLDKSCPSYWVKCDPNQPPRDDKQF